MTARHSRTRSSSRCSPKVIVESSNRSCECFLDMTNSPGGCRYQDHRLTRQPLFVRKTDEAFGRSATMCSTCQLAVKTEDDLDHVSGQVRRFRSVHSVHPLAG